VHVDGEPAAAPIEFSGPAAPDTPYVPDAPTASGMLLFPGEYNLLSQVPGYRLFHIIYAGSRVWFLVCEGICDRRLRPLACRMFPLAPHISKEGIITAQPDPRAVPMCPLAGGEHIEPGFRRAVTKAFRHLAAEPEILEHLQMLSDDLEDMRRFMNIS